MQRSANYLLMKVNAFYRWMIQQREFYKRVFYEIQLVLIINQNIQLLLMLLVNKTHVKLQKDYTKLLYLYAAFNDTFVFMGMQGIGKDVLVHCDKNGKILFEYLFEGLMDAFGMLSDRETINVETRKNRISILNLETHEFRYIEHQFFNEESDQTDIETFADTKYLCIRENGRYNDNRFKLSYYNYPTMPGDKPFNVYESKDNEWTYEYIVRRANNHSMICWFKPRHDEEFQFRTFDLRDDPKGAFHIFKYKNEIGLPYNMNKVECAINTMWEQTKNVFLICTISNKTEQNKVNAAGVVNNNFVCDTKTGTIREAKYWFDVKYNDYLIDYHYMGPNAMYRTYQFENGKVLTTPVYYVNNETEEIVAEETWECTYKTKYFFPGYDGAMIFDCEFENSDTKEFTLSAKKVMNRKEMTLHFLLQLNEDFDEDLLQDVVEMIDYTA